MMPRNETDSIPPQSISGPGFVEKLNRVWSEIDSPKDSPDLNKSIPLSFARERIWFLEQCKPEEGAFNVFKTMRLGSPINIPALGRSLIKLVRQHQPLHTRFTIQNGKLAQIPDKSITPEFTVIDLRGLDSEIHENILRRCLQIEIRRPFDLIKGPLFHVLLAHLNNNEHALHVTLHRIIAGDWLLDLLFRELITHSITESGHRIGHFPITSVHKI